MLEEAAGLHIRGLSIDWSKVGPGSYLRDIPSIAGADSLMLRKPVTLFAGENGSGKSTMFEAIAVAYGFNLSDAPVICHSLLLPRIPQSFSEYREQRSCVLMAERYIRSPTGRQKAIGSRRCS